jgi:hypothetical protein
MDDMEHDQQEGGGRFSGKDNESLLGEAQAEARFEAASARVEAVVGGQNPGGTDSERSEAAERLRDTLAELLDAPSLKLVRQTRDDGQKVESVEREDGETPVNGMPLETFRQLFGVDEYAGDDELVDVLTSASGKSFRIETIQSD